MYDPNNDDKFKIRFKIHHQIHHFKCKSFLKTCNELVRLSTQRKKLPREDTSIEKILDITVFHYTFERGVTYNWGSLNDFKAQGNKYSVPSDIKVPGLVRL